MRSLQPPDILWIHWRVYNSIANLPPSDVCVRSFLYLLYTLIKLLHTHKKKRKKSKKKEGTLSFERDLLDFFSQGFCGYMFTFQSLVLLEFRYPCDLTQQCSFTFFSCRQAVVTVH